MITIDDKKIGIGQITTFDIDQINNEKAEYIKYETPALNPPTNKKRILSDNLNQYSLM